MQVIGVIGTDLFVRVYATLLAALDVVADARRRLRSVALTMPNSRRVQVRR